MINIKVAKIGGSLIEKASDFIKVKNVIEKHKFQVVVISATKGTTNLLEKIAMNLYQGQFSTAKDLFLQFKKRHEKLIGDLDLEAELKTEFNVLCEILSSKLSIKLKSLICAEFDEILSFGERTSSLILSHYLENYQYFDIRNAMITDSNFSCANVEFEKTNLKLNQLIPKKLLQSQGVVTQGFLGSNEEGQTTTLGREGSDYSASIIAGALNAKEITIYTDVAGVYQSDPKKFDNVLVINNLSYEQAELMAEKGAKVLYPKTLRPIKESRIPLIVTNLNESSQTLISNPENESLFSFVMSADRLSVFCPNSDRKYLLDLLNKNMPIESDQTHTSNFKYGFEVFSKDYNYLQECLKIIREESNSN